MVQKRAVVASPTSVVIDTYPPSRWAAGAVDSAARTAIKRRSADGFKSGVRIRPVFTLRRLDVDLWGLRPPPNRSVPDAQSEPAPPDRQVAGAAPAHDAAQ